MLIASVASGWRERRIEDRGTLCKEVVLLSRPGSRTLPLDLPSASKVWSFALISTIKYIDIYISKGKEMMLCESSKMSKRSCLKYVSLAR